jgi:hypothetical protein
VATPSRACTSASRPRARRASPGPTGVPAPPGRAAPARGRGCCGAPRRAVLGAGAQPRLRRLLEALLRPRPPRAGPAARATHQLVARGSTTRPDATCSACTSRAPAAPPAPRCPSAGSSARAGVGGPAAVGDVQRLEHADAALGQRVVHRVDEVRPAAVLAEHGHDDADAPSPAMRSASWAASPPSTDASGRSTLAVRPRRLRGPRSDSRTRLSCGVKPHSDGRTARISPGPDSRATAGALMHHTVAPPAVRTTPRPAGCGRTPRPSTASQPSPASALDDLLVRLTGRSRG